MNSADIIRRSRAAGCVELSDAQIKKMQETLLMMFDDIRQVLEENDIPYTLGGGSVLGAFRHRGFIPWDDDIDINITRSAFNRFVPLFTDRFGEKYWIHIPGITHDYALLFPQIRLKGTSVKTRDDYNNDECGCCIDFFFMENTYDNPVARLWHGIGCQYYGLAVSCLKFFRDREFLTGFAKTIGNKKLLMVTRAKILIGRLLSFHSMDGLVSRADRWNGRCRNEESGYVSFPTGRKHFFGDLYKRKVMYPVSRYTFENRVVSCPCDTEFYLSHLYGDFMNIPANEARESHLYFEPFII